MLCDIADLIEASQHLSILYVPSKAPRKRKREQEAKYSSSQDEDRPPSKRSRTSSSSCTAEERATSDIDKKNIDSLEYWTWIRRWSKEYFEQDSQVREDFE